MIQVKLQLCDLYNIVRVLKSRSQKNDHVNHITIQQMLQKVNKETFQREAVYVEEQEI